jgi:acyl-CoA synthetase (AMP-forming)/AMP-acid ligase II
MTSEAIPGDTLLEVLVRRAEATPDRVAAWFETEPLTHGALWAGIRRAAGALAAAGIGPGDRVVIALPNGLDFFPAFYGVQAAGGVAVPVFPGAPPARIQEQAVRCGAGAIVVTDEAAAAFERDLPGAGPILTPAGLASGAPRGAAPVSPSDLAYLQLTSGSTGEPRAVAISQGALITNVHQLIAGMEITPAERFVSWVPVYHDMGLILKTMVPMAIGAETHLLPTSLSDVDYWLETIERVRGTLTAAPDFAWRLAVRRPLRRDYDLGSLRVAINAAEPVRASTLDAFERRFGLAGVMTSGYGLAEATVGVSMTKPGRRPKVDAAGAVSVGPPFFGVEIEIRRGAGACGPGEVGDIHIRTIARSDGYFQDPEATAALFDAAGFLASGDIGYVDSAGELFVLGRAKNTIIVAGRTIAPREVEEAAETSPGVRFAAAIGVDAGPRAGEQIVVFAEARDPGASAGALAQTAAEITSAVADKVGVRPYEVLLLRPRAIPITHNGKVRHAALSASRRDGSLRARGAVLYPPP